MKSGKIAKCSWASRRRRLSPDARCSACNQELPNSPRTLLLLRRAAPDIRCPICNHYLSRWERGGRGQGAVRAAILSRVREVLGTEAFA